MTAVTPGAALRAARRGNGWTQARLAGFLGCSASAVHHAETGAQVPARAWWQRADGMLGAGGALLRLRAGIVPGNDPVWPVWDEGPEP